MIQSHPYWPSVEAVRASRDVLAHPFYRRWSAGELAPRELAHYAGQYRYAVLALAAASARAAELAPPRLRAALAAHAAEEDRHVDLWDDFTRAVGGRVDAPAEPETERCAQAWAGAPERPFAQTLMALYAIEAGQPAIAAAKRAGLAAHYGLVGGRATAYFALHERLDLEHAAAARALLDQISSEPAGDEDRADAAGLLAEADAVLCANWMLLDGVERAARADAFEVVLVRRG